MSQRFFNRVNRFAHNTIKKLEPGTIKNFNVCTKYILMTAGAWLIIFFSDVVCKTERRVPFVMGEKKNTSKLLIE